MSKTVAAAMAYALVLPIPATPAECLDLLHRQKLMEISAIELRSLASEMDDARKFSIRMGGPRVNVIALKAIADLMDDEAGYRKDDIPDDCEFE